MQLMKLVIFAIAMLLGTAAIAQPNNNFGYTGTDTTGTSTTKGRIISTRNAGHGTRVLYVDNNGKFLDTTVASLLADAVKYADTGVVVPSMYQHNLKFNTSDITQSTSDNSASKVWSAAASYNSASTKADIDDVTGLLDSVNRKIDTSYRTIVNGLLALKLDTNYAATVRLLVSNAVDTSKAYTNSVFLLSGAVGFKGIAYPTTNPGSHVSGRLWQGSVSATSQAFTNFGYTIPAYKQAYFYDNGTTFDTTTIPLDQLVQAQIIAQGLINQTTFETVQIPVVGLSRTRFNQGNLSLCTTNYGTTLTRLVDSSFSYTGYATKVDLYSTRAGNIALKSFSKNGDGTYNVESSLTVPVVVGLNTIDSTTLAGMPIKMGGTFGWYGASSGGGGVGIGTGSMSTKTITGNVSGSNLTFGTAAATQTWGIKVTYRVAPTVATDSVVFPYGKTSPPVYTNQISYTGKADTLTNKVATSTIITDFLINSSGNIQAVSGWKYMIVPIPKGTEKMFVSKLLIRPANPSGSGFIRFTNEGGPTISFSGYNYNSDTSYTVPFGATIFQIDIQDPSTTSSAYANAVISPRGSLVSKILGISIGSSSGGGGGNPFNQSLNTTDDALFNSITTDGLYLKSLPVGNGVEPPGLPVGRMWRDWDGVSKSSTPRIVELP